MNIILIIINYNDPWFLTVMHLSMFSHREDDGHTLGIGQPKQSLLSGI